MRHHGVVTEALLQIERDPFGPTPAECEDQGRAMLFHERRDRVVHRLPVLMGREGAQVGARCDHLQIHPARPIAGAVRTHHSHRARAPHTLGIHFGAGEKFGQPLDRIERRREPDSRRTRRACRAHHSFQPLQREHQMCTALVRGERVEFVDDNVADGAQTLTEARRSQQDEERLRSRDENMRRAAKHR